MKKKTPARRTSSRPSAKSSIRPARNSKTAQPALWNLRLYVAGQTPRSISAFANLKRICEEKLPGQYSIEVIDVAKRPELAQTDQIVALPTLVRKLPEPMKRVIGDLSNLERVMVSIEIERANENFA